MPIPLADRLTAWRKVRGYTQEEAASLLCVSRRTYEGWEYGRPFRFEGLLRLALLAIDLTRKPKTETTNDGL